MSEGVVERDPVPPGVVRAARGRRGPLARTEAEEYEQICELLQRVGCLVWRLSQARASRQSEGLGDLYAMSPKRGAFWVEVKTPAGRLSRAQLQFQHVHAEFAMPSYVVGGVPEVAHFLTTGEVPPWPRRGQPI